MMRVRVRKICRRSRTGWRRRATTADRAPTRILLAARSFARTTKYVFFLSFFLTSWDWQLILFCAIKVWLDDLHLARTQPPPALQLPSQPQPLPQPLPLLRPFAILPLPQRTPSPLRPLPSSPPVPLRDPLHATRRLRLPPRRPPPSPLDPARLPLWLPQLFPIVLDGHGTEPVPASVVPGAHRERQRTRWWVSGRRRVGTAASAGVLRSRRDVRRAGG